MLELQALEDGAHTRERAVAALAVDDRVSSAERVTGLLVEGALAGDALDFLPVVLGVAGGAFRAQAAFMRILVAVGAGGMRQGRHAHERFGVGPHRRVGMRLLVLHVRMALFALHVGMLAQQREIRLRMAEARRSLPGDLAVALFAFAAQLPAVLVEMALGTLRGQAEEGDLLRLLRTGSADGRVADQAVVMAVGALDLRMLALQWIAGLRVVEAFLSFRSPQQIGVAAEVLGMALLTGQLGGREPPMDPAVLDDALLGRLVAGEAGVVGELVAGDVALGAVLQALQVRVRLRQRARREHVRTRAGGREKQRGRQDAFSGRRHTRDTPRRRCALRSR